MKFTRIPENMFKELQLGSGVVLSEFDHSSGGYDPEHILGATSGGLNFRAIQNFIDLGDGIDNCPKNTMELTKLNYWDISLSGTFKSFKATSIASMLAAADVSGNKVTPRNELKASDYKELWWVGDYSEKNGEKSGGYIAIHMLNTLSTGGFQFQSADKETGDADFTYKAHYSLADPDTVPLEIIVMSGTDET